MSFTQWPLQTKPVLIRSKSFAESKTDNKKEHEFHVSFGENFLLGAFDSIYNYKALDLYKQQEINFSQYNDSVLLIVNVASF